jgi:F-type H+-transporting ATPase subunit b
MTLLPIIAAAVEKNPVQEIAEKFGWEPRLFISQCVLFIIVAIVLTKFAYKPLLAMLELRKQQIAEALKNAEATRKELATAQAKSQEIITAANGQANKLIEEARAAAARVQETETQKAIAAAEQIISKANDATKQEHARMLVELRREVGRLVVDTTTKVTGKVLNADDQKRLAEETSRQLAA